MQYNAKAKPKAQMQMQHINKNHNTCSLSSFRNESSLLSSTRQLIPQRPISINTRCFRYVAISFGTHRVDIKGE